MSPENLLLLIVGGAVLLLAASFGAILWRIGRLRRATAAARSWPSTTGRIVAGSLGEFRMPLPRGGTIVRHGALLTYEYAVADRSFRGDRYDLNGPRYFSSLRHAQRMLDKNPAGTVVTVYYDPAEPGSAVLERKAPMIATLWVVLAVSFVIAAFLLGGLAFEVGLFGRGTPIRR